MVNTITWITDPVTGIIVSPVSSDCDLACDAYCSDYGPCAEKCGVLCRPRYATPVSDTPTTLVPK